MVRRIELMQDITDSIKPQLKLELICFKCGVRGEIGKDQFIGKVNVKID